MITKICTKCNIEKEISFFYKDAAQKSGYRPDCKDCKKITTAVYCKNNPEKIRERDRKYKLKRPDVGIKARKKYYESNKYLWILQSRKRKASKLLRVPKWTNTLDLNKINCLYEISSRISKCLGTSFHVDHIVPLQGKTVSGFHTFNNLQILPAKSNLQKGNKWQIY